MSPAPLPLPADLTGWRIAVHDYGGYAFPLELAHWLTARGAEVLHLQCPDVEAPKGTLPAAKRATPGLRTEDVSLGRPLPRYALLRRWWREERYGRAVGRRLASFAPHVVLSANTPPAAQAGIARAVDRSNGALVCWVQDIFTPGVAELLRGMPRPLATAVTSFVRHVEFGVMRRAAGIVVIAPAFLDVLARYGVRHPRTAVIENWCPLSDVSPRPKDNAWARGHGLEDRFTFLYSGTLGKKHDAALLLRLAEHFRDDADVRIVVVARGPGKARLDAEGKAAGLGNLVVLDLQPYEVLPDVLATADVAVSILEPFAAGLSVPSKVYTYFAAARPVLASIAAANQAARMIADTGGGLCTSPEDRAGFIAAAQRLRDDADLRRDIARRQRAHAATAFTMARIGPQFEEMLRACTRVQVASPSPPPDETPYICSPKRKATTV